MKFQGKSGTLVNGFGLKSIDVNVYGERLMNNNQVNESVEEVGKKRVRSRKRFTNWKLIAAGVGIIALLIGE